jgi:hypothetical protein
MHPDPFRASFLRIVFLATALLALCAPTGSHAATVVVDTGGDGATGCTLRAAVDSAALNADQQGCVATGPPYGNDTVQVPAGTPSPIQLGSILIAGGADAITVDGPGTGALDVRAAAGARVLSVEAAGPVTVSDLTLSHGSSTSSGGAVILGAGIELTLDRAAVTDSTVTATQASGAVQATGGAIQNAGTLTVRDSTISDNSVTGTFTGAGTGFATAGGGGIGSSGLLTVINSTIADNTATASIPAGGSGSSAAVLGAGIWESGAQNVVIEGSTVSGNSGAATAPGQSASGAGGGIKTNAGAANDVTVSRSTISGNTITADDSANAGGLDLLPGTVGTGTVESTTLIGNEVVATATAGANLWANRTDFANTIVANPQGGTSCAVDGTVSSSGFNLEQGGDTCGFDDPLTDQVGVVAPGIAPALAANGGPTMTHALLAGSPAIDRGHSLGDPFDQRGLARISDFSGLANAPGGDGTDIGAFELQKACPEQATPGAACPQPAVTPTPAGPTGKRAAALRKCKKIKNKAKRKKCIRKAKKLPV